MAVEELTVRAELRDELSRPLRRVREEVDELGDEARRTERRADSLGRSLSRLATRGLTRVLQPFRRLQTSVRRLGVALGRTRLGRSLSFVGRSLGTLGRNVGGAIRQLGHLGAAAGRAGATIGRTLYPAAKVAGVAIGALAVGMSAAVGFGVKLASDLEQTEVAFTTMMGGADKARAHIEELTEFAKKTPFELPGLLTASRQLQAMSFDPEQIMPTLTAVGDVVGSLGAGQEGIDRVVRALGQMSAKTKVSAQEMLQLAEMGVPAWQILADALGVSVAEAQKMAEQGEVASDVFIDAFVGMTGPLEKFRGGMEAQSQTLAGLFSTLKDTAQLGLADAAKPLVEGLREAMPGMTASLEEFMAKVGPGIAGALATALPPLIDLLGSIMEVAAPVLEVFADLFAELMPTIVPIVQSLAPVIGQLAEALAGVLLAVAPILPPLGVLIGALGGALAEVIVMLSPYIAELAGLFAYLLPQLMPLIPMVLQLVEAFMPLLPPLMEIITALLPPLIALLVPLIGIVAEVASILVDTLGPAIVAAAGFIADVLIPPIQWLSGHLETAVGWLSSLSEGASKVGDVTKGAVKRVGGWLNPFGDTSRPRSPGLGATAAAHSSIDRAAPGRRRVTNVLHGGFAGSDHRRGRALDLVGSGLNGYATALRRAGGFAEHHGSGASRHLHAVYPSGDTARPRARAMAAAAPATGGGRGGYDGPLIGQVVAQRDIDVEAAVERALARRDRRRRERGA